MRSLTTCLCWAVALGGAHGWAQGPPAGQSKSGEKKKSPDQQRSPEALREGNAAPDFELKSTDGKKSIKLSSFRGQKPVALIFGSYT